MQRLAEISVTIAAVSKADIGMAANPCSVAGVAQVFAQRVFELLLIQAQISFLALLWSQVVGKAVRDVSMASLEQRRLTTFAQFSLYTPQEPEIVCHHDVWLVFPDCLHHALIMDPIVHH